MKITIGPLILKHLNDVPSWSLRKSGGGMLCADTLSKYFDIPRNARRLWIVLTTTNPGVEDAYRWRSGHASLQLMGRSGEVMCEARFWELRTRLEAFAGESKDWMWGWIEYERPSAPREGKEVLNVGGNED